MQDRYAGDVGDFGKFSLLKSLFVAPHDRIGVIWYLFPDECHNNDGRHTNYLDNPDFLEYDRDLCERLSAVVNGERSVAALEKAGILPTTNTVYFSERLDFHLRHPSQSETDKQAREERRKGWLERAVQKVSDRNAIFLDPDNGLEIPSCPKTSQMKAGKFAYYSEILELASNKDVVVIYQHLSFNGTHESQIHARVDELRLRINPTGAIFALRNRPFSPRAYFILTSKPAQGRVKESLERFLSSRHGKHWDSCHEDGVHMAFSVKR